MQLQKNKAKFDELGIQMISVFREEEDGPAGAMKTTKKTGFTPILLDTPADKTKGYSQGGFFTYLIGKDGTILAELSGTKKTRPTAEAIISEAEKVFAKEK